MPLKPCTLTKRGICAEDPSFHVSLLHYTKSIAEDDIAEEGLLPQEPPDDVIIDRMKMDWKFGDLPTDPRDMSDDEFEQLFEQMKREQTVVYAAPIRYLDRIIEDAHGRGADNDLLLGIRVNDACADLFEPKNIDMEFEWTSQSRVPSECIAKIINWNNDTEQIEDS